MVIMHKKLNRFILSFLFIGMVFGNVTVTVGDVEVDGYTTDIVVPVNVSNSNDAVGGFQFDIMPVPLIIEISGATPVDGDNYSADFNILNDGSGRVVFYSNSENGIAEGGNDVVLNLHYDGSDILSALVNLETSNLTVSDEDGAVIDGTVEDGSIMIGNVVFLSATTDTGDVSEEVYIDINLDNPGIVGGIQFDIYDTPNYLDITGFTTTNRTNGFTVEFNEFENGMTRVLIFDPNNGNIGTGTGAILNMEMLVHDNAYNSNVGVNFDNVIVTDDIGGTYWIAGADSGTVTVSPGYIEEPHNLEAQNGMDAQVLLNWDAPFGPIPAEFSEDFEEGDIPEGWGLTTNSAQGWFITQDGSSDFWGIPTHSWYMCSNDDMADDDGSVDFLIVPPLNVSGAEAITLNFSSYFDGAYSQTAHIKVSTDGTNFTEVTQIEPGVEWVTESIDLSDYSGASNLYIAFHSNDNGAWASGWAIDDVLISFSVQNLNRIIHYELTELGEWAISAPKEEIISEYGGGIPHELKVDIDYPVTQDRVPVELDSYKIYRSLDNITFEELIEVEGDVTSYLDDEVENSTTYYYYVTAIYPDGSESGATNTVSATPVEWVEFWMSNGASLSGQMDTIDFFINNESDLGLFYFEILDYPNVLNTLNIISTERTSSWALEIADQGDGTMAITGISLGLPLTAGSGAVCRAVVYPDADEAMTVTMSYTAGSAVQDMNYVDLNWTAEGSTYEVGIETQYASLTGGSNFGTGQFTTSFIMANTQPVYGIQLDIVADPPFMSGTNIEVSGLMDFSGWEISGNVLGNVYRVLMFDNAFNNPIYPGIAHIADISYSVAGGVPEGTIVTLSMSDVSISDINNLPMHTEGIDAEIYLGTPPLAFSIQNVSGSLSPGGVGSFDVHLDNTELANILEFYLLDLPESMTVTGITGVGRFDDGIIDGSSVEQEDGSYYFLGFDFSTGIEPGSGPILQVDVQFDNDLVNSSIIMTMVNVAAGDAGANPITSISHGFAQFTGNLGLDETSLTPMEFALHANYPNPFNPTTKIIYDLAQDSEVRLDIFDLRGRNVKTLVNTSQIAGRHLAQWNATDNFGQPVSAGVYLYRLYAGNKVFTQKMILMK